MKNYLLIITLVFTLNNFSQDYTSYFTGNAVDVVTQPAGGVCMMGGASEDDNAMIWFLERANGGDVLVLRASGSSGYNNYFYTELGVSVNSVETIVFHNANAANDPYIHQRIEQAEAIWFAGGDQWNYISYWRNTPVDSLINKGIAERKIVIGGTSAGMAILGQLYFTAQNGTVTSATALNNPYNNNVTVDDTPFLNVPYLNNVITDTHYDNPDRRGRHSVFMARAMKDLGYLPKGIACEEYVAVCVDTFGIARVFGGYPTYDEQAYFIQTNCALGNPQPETCLTSTPLTWNSNNQALVVYKINATPSGTNTFDLNNWNVASGGEWQYWWIDNGVLNVSSTTEFNCDLSINQSTRFLDWSIYPNPTNHQITVTFSGNLETFSIYNSAGVEVKSYYNLSSGDVLPTNDLASGMYFIVLVQDNKSVITKLIVEE